MYDDTLWPLADNSVNGHAKRAHCASVRDGCNSLINDLKTSLGYIDRYLPTPWANPNAVDKEAKNPEGLVHSILFTREDSTKTKRLMVDDGYGFLVSTRISEGYLGYFMRKQFQSLWR
ncbi:hypothetical protein PV325_007725 [Microctonus aethiopoides]|nr:hypothetical protein PV325_007725 [Microctonus aethiopoides]